MMWHLDATRTTLDLDDDVLDAARSGTAKSPTRTSSRSLACTTRLWSASTRG
jgi:hypothetical protein